jgi:hypothetical protein
MFCDYCDICRVTYQEFWVGITRIFFSVFSVFTLFFDHGPSENKVSQKHQLFLSSRWQTRHCPLVPANLVVRLPQWKLRGNFATEVRQTSEVIAVEEARARTNSRTAERPPKVKVTAAEASSWPTFWMKLLTSQRGNSISAVHVILQYSLRVNKQYFVNEKESLWMESRRF